MVSNVRPSGRPSFYAAVKPVSTEEQQRCTIIERTRLGTKSVKGASNPRGGTRADRAAIAGGMTTPRTPRGRWRGGRRAASSDLTGRLARGNLDYCYFDGSVEIIVR